MNKITQLKLVRKAHIKALSVFEPYQGKNLNRYKVVKGLQEWQDDLENNPPPFEFNGILGGVSIRDWSKVDITPLKARILELEEVIHELDLFDNGDAEEYKEIKKQIKILAEKQRVIKAKYRNIPGYFLDDFVETK